jgi:hypothetical protein
MNKNNIKVKQGVCVYIIVSVRGTNKHTLQSNSIIAYTSEEPKTAGIEKLLGLNM